MFFIIISALHVSDGFPTHRQELIKLYVQPWVLSCFPAVYRWCECVGTVQLHAFLLCTAGVHALELFSLSAYNFEICIS
jgi:hypothetical protein